MLITDNNKRIAKNTLFLYFRMLLIMGVSLFTVRVVLKVLGAEDYGLHNVIGGVVVMLSFFTSTMTSASMRFFTFELGRKDYTKLNQFFNLTIFTYVGIAILILILAETVGLWFVKTQLTIPKDRLNAALWVYQFSIGTFIVQMFVIPFNSMIIAHEKMNIYAIISIIESLLKLLIVYFLVIITSIDKLVLYSILLLIVSIIISSLYILYCFKNYDECKIKWFYDKQMVKELLTYSGWSLWGAVSLIIRNQGINILLNIFFNPAVNAARAIAYQVNTAVKTFITNFFQAVRPQITKMYAAGENNEMLRLIFQSSKFAYYLVLILSVPILMETPYILALWLTETPEYTIIFTRLVIITTMIESLSYPFQTSISATGKIGLYQTITGGLLILNLPFSYLLLKLDYPPQSTFYVAIVVAILSQVSRVLFARKMHQMLISLYLKDVVLTILLVSFMSFIAPIIISSSIEEQSVSRFVLIIFTSLVSSLFAIVTLGLSKGEKVVIKTFIKQKIFSKFKAN